MIFSDEISNSTLCEAIANAYSLLFEADESTDAEGTGENAAEAPDDTATDENATDDAPADVSDDDDDLSGFSLEFGGEEDEPKQGPEDVNQTPGAPESVTPEQLVKELLDEKIIQKVLAVGKEMNATTVSQLLKPIALEIKRYVSEKQYGGLSIAQLKEVARTIAAQIKTK